MTGRRILLKLLGWDLDEYAPKMWYNTQNSATKRWSKRARRMLNRDCHKQIQEEIYGSKN